ncbi:MAG: NfeD family protein [Alphaproteobacteria bacterium]
MTLLYWHWLVLGAALVALETVIPGVFFLWFGVAGLVTGVLLLMPVLIVLPAVPWQGQVLLFAILSVVSIIIGRRLADRDAANNDHPHLNQPAQRIVGREYTLQMPIADGSGTLSIQGNTWIITGPDLPAGTRIRVVALVEGELQVTPAAN